MAVTDHATRRTNHYVVPATAETVHWGYFSRSLKPVVSADSGDFLTIETLTHHAFDDHVRIIDVKPRGCHNPAFSGRAFGSNAAAWWGFHYNDLLTDPKPREVITIYELDATGGRNWAHAVYNYRWVPQTDPFGVVHRIIDYPGVPVDHVLVEENHGILKGVRIPVRPHFGVIAVAPQEAEFVDSVPPGYFGGNIDNWRIGRGTVMHFPVAVPGALFSVGDPHASQ